LGENNKYDYFPSVGIAYKVVETKTVLLTILKLEETLVKQVTKNLVLTQLFQEVLKNGTLNVDNTNADLKWETTQSYGIGADFELFNNRLTGSVDYFKRYKGFNFSSTSSGNSARSSVTKV
jgi:iron complex outermembrane receptor protein